MRATALALLPLTLLACSRPEPAAQPPQVRAESAPTAAAAAAPSAPAPVAVAVPPVPEPAAQPQGAAGSPRHFGAAAASDAQAVHLAAIVAAPQQYNGHALQVDGTVVAVCQAMGCWMEIRDEATQAHIRMHGHSFFVPRDVNGHHATVQATLVAAHPATECDQEAHAATGRVAQVELDATSVQVD
jgi:hypothetical protein